MTPYETLMPFARKLAHGLAAKRGVHFADREMVANCIAQVVHGASIRGELQLPEPPNAISTEETFEDNPFNRQRLEKYGKFEVMGVDQDFWEKVEGFLTIGKRYRITIQEIP